MHIVLRSGSSSCCNIPNICVIAGAHIHAESRDDCSSYLSHSLQRKSKLIEIAFVLGTPSDDFDTPSEPNGHVRRRMMKSVNAFVITR